MRRWLPLLICLVLATLPAQADEHFPKPGWEERPDPIASPNAVAGGEISAWVGQYPKSLNYYLDNNALNAQLFGIMFDTLLSMNPLTLEYEPGLADSWTISADKKSFTFHIDPRARWSDGTPITAQDVKWTFDAITNPKNLTGVHKVDMERFEPPVILAPDTIRFSAKTVHWQNLGAAGSISILCKHAYEKLDFNKINFELPVVSGPYRLGTLNEGVFITLERRSDWWHQDAPNTRGVFNFQTIRFRFFADSENAFEAFKKGLIDLYPVYTSRLWVNETQGEKFRKNWIIKQKVYNSKPVGFQGFAMNMRRPPFDDVRARLAMAHLVDRRKMNSTMMYRQYTLHRSYFEDLYSKENPCPNPLIEFDPTEARRLLAEAGWRVNPDTGFLEKDGERFSFKFLTRDPSTEKFINLLAEDLKDVGIELVIDKKDWAAWLRDMEEFNYQMTWASWSSPVFKNPEGMWSSKEAERRGGNNITGFENAQVDALIEKQKAIFDVQERNRICRQIDAIIYAAVPYVLLWNTDYTRLLYWNKFGLPPTVLSKYSDESGAFAYWWFDPDSAAELADAMQTGAILPPREPVVHFDTAFNPQ